MATNNIGSSYLKKIVSNALAFSKDSDKKKSIADSVIEGVYSGLNLNDILNTMSYSNDPSMVTFAGSIFNIANSFLRGQKMRELEKAEAEREKDKATLEYLKVAKDLGDSGFKSLNNFNKIFDAQVNSLKPYLSYIARKEGIDSKIIPAGINLQTLHQILSTPSLSKEGREALGNIIDTYNKLLERKNSIYKEYFATNPTEAMLKLQDEGSSLLNELSSILSKTGITKTTKSNIVIPSEESESASQSKTTSTNAFIKKGENYGKGKK